MMNAVHGVLKLRAGSGGRWNVEQVSMYVVFDPREEQQSAEEQRDGQRDR